MNSGNAKSFSRISSIDLLRGAVMVLMAIDHVRVYSGVPAGGPDPSVFFTRWVTHFCAPVFAFFAGTSAFLYGRKIGDKARLGRFLVARGFLLVILELTVIRFSWTFNFQYSEFTLAGVIWMLGWCMVLLAPLVQLPPTAVGILGVAVIVLQQTFASVGKMLPAPLRPWWEFIYPAGAHPPLGMAILYVLVPWIGVMAAGYGFGLIMVREVASRRRICLTLGLTATALFLVLGMVSLLSNATPRNAPPLLFRLLNQQKYPASPLFLLMTLGPAIALLPLAERARGWLAGVLETFGRVPFFYYLLHIPAIHLAALLVNCLREGTPHAGWYASAPYTFIPRDHRWGLPLLYVVWFAVVVLLYFVCRWYAVLKSRNRASWLKYI